MIIKNLTPEQGDAIGDCYTTLIAIYRTDPNCAGAIVAAESAANLVAAFPEVAELEEACKNIPMP